MEKLQSTREGRLDCCDTRQTQRSLSPPIQHTEDYNTHSEVEAQSTTTPILKWSHRRLQYPF
ncbi:unnamed protein product [Arctogadus glacialis]